jgi:hypothetical protein
VSEYGSESGGNRSGSGLLLVGADAGLPGVIGCLPGQ